MRQQIISDLATHIDKAVAKDLVDSYEQVVSRHSRLDVEGCLVAAGRFVENTFRALEFIRTGVAPKEIKSPSATARALEAATNLNEAVRLLIPRVALAMVYEVRSKRGAVHVKEIDPRAIDAALAVCAASWVLAELLRLYHHASEAAVLESMQALLRSHIPFVESFGDEIVVTAPVPCDDEILLLLSRAEPDGLDRRALGQMSKYSPSAVTRAIRRLDNRRYVHLTGSGRFRITGPGAAHVAAQAASHGVWTT
jgi:hypothetical protein